MRGTGVWWNAFRNMKIAAVILGSILYAGWPTVAFVHHRFRRGRPLAPAFLTTLATGLGSFFVLLLSSEGGLVPRHPAVWVGTLALSFNLVWVTVPYLILMRRGFQAVRRHPSFPLHSTV